MSKRENDSDHSHESWLRRLVDSSDEWSNQRILMETQLSSLESLAADARSPEGRALRAVLTAQCYATRTLLEARTTALDALLVAAVDFTHSSQSASAAVDLQELLSRVARTLVDAQDEAARTLLAAQTAAAEVLRAEQAAETATLAAAPEDAETLP